MRSGPVILNKEKEVKRLKISKLVLDYNIYPREHINNYHVDEMVEALNAGAHMPPIKADKSTLKVVDGWHRIEAFRKKWGDEAEIEVDLKEYADAAEMFQDAIRDNASHGQSLSPMDQAHCLAKSAEFKLEPAMVAKLLNITAERGTEIISNRIGLSGGDNVVLKGSTAHFAGKKMTAEQVAYNKTAGGLHQSFYVNQVIAMLKSDSVNWDDERVTSGLKELLKLLEAELKAKV